MSRHHKFEKINVQGFDLFKKLRSCFFLFVKRGAMPRQVDITHALTRACSTYVAGQSHTATELHTFFKTSVNRKTKLKTSPKISTLK